jgi:hypothetical protein
MLRMRPKPPAGLPTINAGPPWTEMDLSDFKALIRERRSIVEIAEFLGREIEEVEAKAANLQ